MGRIEELEAELAKLKSGTQLDCEVTVVIPTHNAMHTLGPVLFRLEKGAQSVPLKLVLCDNGSDDGTGEFLAAIPARQYWRDRFRDVLVLQAVPQMGGKTPRDAHNKNVEHMWCKLSREVQTPYTLFVDADVLVPSGAVGAMLEAMRSDPKLGMLGIPYGDMKTESLDHVRMGCTMTRTDITSDVEWESKGCCCRFLHQETERRGYQVKYMSGISARHLRLEV